VEFILLLPVLVLLALGCLDFGRFAYSYIAVTNAARNGAGYASSHPYADWASGVRAAVNDEMSALSGFDDSKLDVPAPAIIPDGKDGRWRVGVTVEYPFETLIPWPGIPQQLNLKRTVVMPGIGPLAP
jgi:Flp pilus assembly protein TadG